MPKKRVFLDFSCFLKSSHQDESFSFLTKFHIFNGLDLKKSVFRLIIFVAPTKKVFFDLFIFKSSHQDETFSFLPRLHIFNGLD